MRELKTTRLNFLYKCTWVWKSRGKRLWAIKLYGHVLQIQVRALLARSQPVALCLGHVHASAPESGEGQAPSLPHPSSVSLCPARISRPPLIVTVPTAASMTVILAYSPLFRKVN